MRVDADNLEHALSMAAEVGWSRSDVPADLVERATPAGLVRLALTEWAVIAGLWVAIAVTPAWWFYIPLGLLLAGRYHALGVVLHDATHMPLRHKGVAIRVVEVACAYPIATTLNAMRYHHLRHHRDSGMQSDPYFKGVRQDLTWKVLNTLRGLLLVPFWTVRALVGMMAAHIPPMRNVYGRVFLQDRSGADLRASPELIECARADHGQVAFQAGVAALAFAAPSAVLWGYIVPVSLAGLLAARRLLIEHNHERASDRRVDTIVRTTNDNHLGWAGKLILAPRNIGFHIVHHIHPQARLEVLPRLRNWYLQRYGEAYPAAGGSGDQPKSGADRPGRRNR